MTKYSSPTTKESAMRIDKLVPGQQVVLGFKHGNEPATFLGIEGEGDERRARFEQPESDGVKTFEWEAYRYNNGWAYGTSADRLKLIGLAPEPDPATVRRATVTNTGVSLDTVRAYLPANYTAEAGADGVIVIEGVDNAGWTLDGYVIPRLGSGLIWAEEIA